MPYVSHNGTAGGSGLASCNATYHGSEGDHAAAHGGSQAHGGLGSLQENWDKGQLAAILQHLLAALPVL